MVAPYTPLHGTMAVESGVGGDPRRARCPYRDILPDSHRGRSTRNVTGIRQCVGGCERRLEREQHRVVHQSRPTSSAQGRGRGELGSDGSRGAYTYSPPRPVLLGRTGCGGAKEVQRARGRRRCVQRESTQWSLRPSEGESAAFAGRARAHSVRRQDGGNRGTRTEFLKPA